MTSVKWLSLTPRIISFPDFLSAYECSRIIKLAKMKGLESSSPILDSDNVSTNTKIRTSSSCWMSYDKSQLDYGCQSLEDENMLKSISNRISLASCLPEENGETFQILKYKAGEYYKCHPDFFENATQKSELAMGGQRLATMLIYLTNVPKGYGGQTYFPDSIPLYNNQVQQNVNSSDKLSNKKQKKKKGIYVTRIGNNHSNKNENKSGVYIQPQQGLGVLFFNTCPSGTIDIRSIHESLPIKPKQNCDTSEDLIEKWTMTRWIRERKYPKPLKKRVASE